MYIRPSIEELRSLDTREYTVAPVACEILSDFITPIEALRILKNADQHAYMLESAQANENWGRYTFLGFAPKLEITCINGNMKAGDKEFHTDNPTEDIRKILSEYKSNDVKDEEEFKDVDLMLFDKVIAFDNVRQKIVLIVNVKLASLDAEYERAIKDLEQLSNLLHTGERFKESAGKVLGEFKPLFNKEEYCEMVEKGKHYIYEGDIFQIVLSNRIEAPFEGCLLDTYRALRTINPSPYMFYFSGTDVEVAGASPETLVKLKDGVLHTFPLAGSRPRGATKEEDEALTAELLKDEKELAEHNMLVDLGRNDLGKISKFGTVEVENYMEVLKFSHIMHIGSTVRGEIRNDKDALDAIEAVLPAGTLSGAPKIRACQLIDELENNKRGIYGGAIGYIDFTGNMDTCIAIRIAFKKNGKVFVRSGAGIVADSVPEKEFEESLNKARAVVNALSQEM